MSWLLPFVGLPPAAALTLFTASKMLPPRQAQLASFAAFFIASIFLMCLSALYGVLASIFLRVVGYGGLSQWTVARFFKWTMGLGTGVWFETIENGSKGGEEALRTRPAVFIVNHQTELDVLMLGAMFPKYCSVTAKKSLKYTPFLGWFSMQPIARYFTSSMC